MTREEYFEIDFGPEGVDAQDILDFLKTIENYYQSRFKMRCV